MSDSFMVVDWDPQPDLGIPVPRRDLREYLPALQTQLGADIITLQGVTKRIGPKAGSQFDLLTMAEKSLAVKDAFFKPFWEAEELRDGKEKLFFHGMIQYGDAILVLNQGYETIVRESSFYQGRFDAAKGTEPKIMDAARQPRAVQRLVIERTEDGRRLQLVNVLGVERPSLEQMQDLTQSAIMLIDPKLPTVVTGDFCCEMDPYGFRELARRGYLRSARLEFEKESKMCGAPLAYDSHPRNNIMFGRDWITPVGFAILGPHPWRFDYGSGRESRLLGADLLGLPNCPSAVPPVVFEFAVGYSMK